jgi:hypothetical protein
MSGIQAKICLPLSRSSLTSYALETRGALRILGFLNLDDLISNDLMPQGGLGPPYIAQRVQHEPLDQLVVLAHFAKDKCLELKWINLAKK